jgi:phosphatidylethanolamine/phosphatidyl-N-methylethanolamine N-methyltransferase
MSGSNRKPESAQLPREHGWTFFRQWLKNPLAMAAVSPSSRGLAQNMLRELPPGATRVVELGGGTGVFTRETLASGIAPENLLVLELNQALHVHLQKMFPAARIACGDARDLQLIAHRIGFLDHGPADAVLSGLGLLSMARPTQHAIVEAAFSVMAPHGRFIQFTYGPSNPVAREVMRDLDLTSRRASFTLWNVPPATVYVLSRTRSRRVVAVKSGR